MQTSLCRALFRVIVVLVSATLGGSSVTRCCTVAMPLLSYCIVCYLQAIIGGHVRAVYQHAVEESRILSSGMTPVRRRGGSSQTQVRDDKQGILLLS